MNDDDDLREAVFGKRHVGLVGLVTQIEIAEKGLASELVNRAAGDKRLWRAIGETRRRIDRMVWIAMGVGAGAGSGGAFLGSLLG